MSSAAQQMMEPQHSDSRRLLTAFLVAVLLHILVFVLFAIVRLESPPNLAPVSVDLVPGTLSGPALPAGQPQVAATAMTQSRGGSSQGFVIPTPRQSSSTGPTQPTGPAFREAGPSNFQAGGAQPATSPVQEPVFPRVKTPQEGGAAATGGGAPSGAPAHGVLVEGGGQAPAKGALDLGSLDKSLAAGAQGSGGQEEAASGSGGGGGGNAGQGGGGTGDLRFQWDQPGAAKARKLLADPQPKIPQWVSKEGLSLTVLVTFTLTPDGLLRNVNVEASSGYNEVDAAVVEAVRLWRFSADPSAGTIHGQLPYAIRAR